jgi:hypothetical protein
MSVRSMAVCMLALCFVITVGCSGKPARLLPPPIDALAAGTMAIEMYDTDKDGKISGAELDKCPALKAAMTQIDTTGDKTITAAKITARIKAWQNSKLGRNALSCNVLHNGKPLADADVNFVPEKFLGESMKTASGKTDQNGMAMMSVPTSGERDDPPGVPPGLYRVEITKAGENIPAKYNTDTTLGQEQALDAVGVREGVKFDLRY